MNANAGARHYDRLTPEERFRLIVAAGVRGDDAERNRLVNAGKRIVFSMPDHAPQGHAFKDLVLLIFIELLEAAADYFDAFHQADDAELFSGEEADDEPDDGEADDDEAEPDVDTGEAEAKREDRTIGERLFDLALAKGFVLKTKANGWKLFCERMNVPPFAGWEGLPGLDRLQDALKLAEEAAFVPEGFLRWMNDVRPAGEPKLTEVPLTVERMADATAKLFRDRVEWWGG
jgi:hypothetical protein